MTHLTLLLYGSYILFISLNGFFLYRICRGFAKVKEKLWARMLLFITLMLTSGMVIWVGDNNFAMTLPFYLVGFLAATKGDLLGRITVGGVFFCFIMSVCAMADTYFTSLDRFGYYDIVSRLVRPLVFGLFYLIFYKRLKGEAVKLPHHLWKLCAGLTLLPFAALSVLILPAYWMPESILLHDLNWFQGAVILPISLLASLALLCSILVLADYEAKAQAAAFSQMRELYYQGLKREQAQVRTLRHDLRNHLNAALGLLERDETEKARKYLFELADSQALHSSRRICENEIVNIVLASKCEDMEQRGICADIQILLPAALPIADTDLCALLGNAIDNAIEAAQKSKDKHITIRCKAERGLFMLRVENSFAGEIRRDLRTTKKDKKLHGFGLAGMREIVTRYGGFLQAAPMGEKFELLISIPMLPQPKTGFRFSLREHEAE